MNTAACETDSIPLPEHNAHRVIVLSRADETNRVKKQTKKAKTDGKDAFSGNQAMTRPVGRGWGALGVTRECWNWGGKGVRSAKLKASCGGGKWAGVGHFKKI